MYLNKYLKILLAIGVKEQVILQEAVFVSTSKHINELGLLIIFFS